MKITYRKTSKETEDEITYSVGLSATEIESTREAEEILNILKTAMLEYAGQTTLDDNSDDGSKEDDNT